MNMRHLVLLLLFVTVVTNCYCQKAHTVLPLAKVMNDSAARVYSRVSGDPKKLGPVFHLLDEAIKADNLYRDAWVNKMTLQSQTDHFDEALKTIKQMDVIFPNDLELLFLTGVLEHKCKHKNDAVTTFNKLIKLYDDLIKKNPKNPNVKNWLMNKGIILILANRPGDGKALLSKMYNEEKSDVVKSSLGFYINSDKETIINDKLPGKWD